MGVPGPFVVMVGGRAGEGSSASGGRRSSGLSGSLGIGVQGLPLVCSRSSLSAPERVAVQFVFVIDFA